MLADLKPILGKVLVILIIVLIYYLITKYNNSEIDNSFETFVNNIEQNKKDYLKLKETYIEPKSTSLELLYTNYSGEELNKDIWEDKTLDQCIDTCNKMNNCVGFSRDSVLDTEPSKCYPRTIIDKCHSNRKGNYKQMSNAIKYNSYIKSNTPDIINKCIGDSELTLNRNIHIKSYLMPNKYIGNIGDGRVSMIDINMNNFKQKCNFRLEKGKEGVGSVSFLHIDTNKYLYRDNNNILIFKNINDNKTEDRQRISFNIIDGLSNGIMLKVIPIEGETKDKYIMIDNPYLNISIINNISKKSKNTKHSTFYIVDNIINSKIIDNKNKIINKNHNNINNTIPSTTLQNTKINNSKITTNEKFENNLDTSNDINFYNKLFNSNDNSKFPTYLEDNYLNNKNNYSLMHIDKKFNNIILNKTLSNSISKNEEEYNSLNNLNKEIEKEINNKNLNLDAKNDTIINNLNKLKIKDLANDYYFFKSISSNK